MSGKIRLRVSLVILPMDAFTGKPIAQKEFLVWAEGEATPLVKREGYRVFSGISKRYITVRLSGRFYQNTRVDIDLLALNPQSPVQKVYVLPDRTYPFPADTAYMQGKMSGQSVLLAAAISDMNLCRLRADCGEGERTLAVYRGEQKDFSGKIYYLTDQTGERAEWIRLASYVQDVYGLEEPLRYTYRKAEARMYEAVRCVADERREAYFLPVRTAGKADLVRCLICKGQETQEFDVCLRAGETLHRDI